LESHRPDRRGDPVRELDLRALLKSNYALWPKGVLASMPFGFTISGARGPN